MPIIRYFTRNDCEELRDRAAIQLNTVFDKPFSFSVEKCYHIETRTAIRNDAEEHKALLWLLKHPQANADTLRTTTTLPPAAASPLSLLIEIGPRFNFSTAFSTNCVNICQNVGLHQVVRLEVSRRYLITLSEGEKEPILTTLIDVLGDRMTECFYTEKNLPQNSFDEQLPKTQEPWYYVPILEHGRKALETINAQLGLAFGDWDLDYYTHLFKHILQRDPTTVELFDCAQSNSEHSRHWFFRGRMIVDGQEEPKSLIRMIMDTQQHTNPNNTIKFSDNSSAIKGFQHNIIQLTNVEGPGEVTVESVNSDLIFTAETHNMPTAVAPFSGATTGTGGRIRDVQGVGRGGIPIAGTAGYCVGCLNIPGYRQPYENPNFKYPKTFAKPLRVLIEASDGASDYGNKFGEPVISGFAYSYGLMGSDGERDEYVKPIMFSGGLGTMNASMREKLNPERGMLLAKIGGPVYRIGVGGGAASSVEVQGSNSSDFDFNAVQRGDAEMENKLNRVVRACVELGNQNPILAIHDQGAGGNGNVLKELVEPGFAGAIIFSKEFQLGDPTINALELWGAEYQENNALLCKPGDRALLERICERERCPLSFVGVVTGNGRVTLVESTADFQDALQKDEIEISKLGPVPFDLKLKDVLGDMPQREYYLERKPQKMKPLNFEPNFEYTDSLNRVLSLVAVGSKRFLTNKVDRCVTGLVAQQQCVGPLHTPLADFGLVAVSHFSHKGIATSIGTQPIKGLLSTAAMARLCVAEALSNLVFVKITELADVKCSGNWMWPAKLNGEGVKLFEACKEMCHMMEELHIAVDGGKDSLSMAAQIGHETVKSPGTLVISTYAPCPDINIKVTPDIKGPAYGIESSILWINIEQHFRLGGSSLSQAYGQQGLHCPNVLRTDILSNAFNVTQELLAQEKLLAGHDVSDGGLLVCLLEMAIGGIAGMDIDLTRVMQQLNSDVIIDHAAINVNKPEMAILYSEECGWVIEVATKFLPEVQQAFSVAGVPNYCIGVTNDYGLDAKFKISSQGQTLLWNTVRTLYQAWERTSFELEKLQANPECITQEFETLNFRTGPQYSFKLEVTAEKKLLQCGHKAVLVAVLREEGINSDREMMACLLKAKFEVHDVTMSDLLNGRTSLDRYRGIVFPGGFSYADTLGSAKGWAANIMFSKLLAPQFHAFKSRKDTFSLGICNGCQLMCLIGWVGSNKTFSKSDETAKVIDNPDVALLRNKSQRFECRWSTVRITQNNSIMLHNMIGSVLGCWVAHAEGRFSFRSDEVYQHLKQGNYIPLRYVDDQAQNTEVYPMNPNGSHKGVAGLVSSNGRHLALMPHPERCGNMFQWPYVSPNFKISTAESPWQFMFNNAFKWCIDYNSE